MTFKSEWDRETTLIIKASNQMVRATAIDMFGTIVEMTPVDMGLLRGNWQLTLGRPATGITEDRDPSKDGSPTKAKINAEIARFKTGDMYLTNNLPYAEPIARGHSKQQPNGWIERVVAGFQRAVDKAARENKLP